MIHWAVRAAQVAAAVTAMFAAGQVWAANGIAQLRAFVDNTRSASGEFEQTVTSASGRKPQHARGEFVFARPGKFRWAYEQPYVQVLVSDGDKLWSWDRDLNQVTVKTLGDALGATPAAILAGSGEFDRNFDLAEAGFSDGVDWVFAKPKGADSGFESVRMGFANGLLKRMELQDNFGQSTLIVFTSFVADVRPDPALFRFTPPAGADVIGE